MTRPFFVVHRPINAPERQKEPAETPRHTSPPKLSPLALAGEWLKHRLEERPTGYYLDGQPAKLNQIMQATNRLLKQAGVPQLDANPAWVVDE